MPLAASQLLADPIASFAANPEWTRYAFMFPVGIFVATCAQVRPVDNASVKRLEVYASTISIDAVRQVPHTAVVAGSFGVSIRSSLFFE